LLIWRSCRRGGEGAMDMTGSTDLELCLWIKQFPGH